MKPRGVLAPRQIADALKENSGCAIRGYEQVAGIPEITLQSVPSNSPGIVPFARGRMDIHYP
jgi:hypothetical protein